MISAASNTRHSSTAAPIAFGTSAAVIVGGGSHLVLDPARELVRATNRSPLLRAAVAALPLAIGAGAGGLAALGAAHLDAGS